METLLFGLVGQIGTVWHVSLLWYVLIALVLTHITIVSVTLYLHRSKTHGSVNFHTLVEHFFRFWLWLTTGMKTHEWVSVHRKHHDKCETTDDPHSPQILGIKKLMLDGDKLYTEEVRRGNALVYVKGKLSAGLPDDWLEHNVYSRYPWLGLVILAVTQILLLGLPGIIIFYVQARWIPIWAAGVINGIGHYWGYRNANTPDASRNICPIGMFIGGEELHNNHHAYQTSAKFSKKWWEFDIGWVYICILEWFGLAKVNRVDHLPVYAQYVDPLEKDSLLNLFLHHKSYLAKQFSLKIRPENHDVEIRKLIDTFLYWSQSEDNIVSGFELEQWISTVRQYGKESPELERFVNWFIYLHEADEIAPVK